MMTKQFRLLIALCLLSVAAAAQTDKATLTVSGEVLKPLSLTLEDMGKMPQTKLKAKDREGKEHEYGGVALLEILKSAGVTLGGQLRGENLAKYLLFTAADNYQVVYSLPEVDSEFSNDVVLLATSVDGKPLPNGEGPFRLVNPTDKKPARWIRELRSIKVLFAKE